MMFFVKDKLSGKQEEGVVKSEHKPYTGTAGIKRFYQPFLFYYVCILQYIHLLFFFFFHCCPLALASHIWHRVSLCPGWKLLCRNSFICIMNLGIPLWISTVCGRYSWLESDGLRRTNITRKIQFFPHTYPAKEQWNFSSVCFVYVLTVKNPSAVTMCDLKANQLIKKKSKFKRNSRLCRSVHWTPQWGSV